MPFLNELSITRSLLLDFLWGLSHRILYFHQFRWPPCLVFLGQQQIFFSNYVQFFTVVHLALNQFCSSSFAWFGIISDFFDCFLIFLVFLATFPWFLWKNEISFSFIKIHSLGVFQTQKEMQIRTTHLLNIVRSDLFSPTTYKISLTFNVQVDTYGRLRFGYVHLRSTINYHWGGFIFIQIHSKS